MTGAGLASADQSQIYARHSVQVGRLAYRLTGNRQDAEDLTHDVFLRVFASMGEYEAGNFDGWLHRITTNMFLDRARKSGRQRSQELTPMHEERLVDPAALPHDVVVGAGFDPDIEAALATLPVRFRVPVVLCDVEQLSQAEIADVLGVKISTVRTRIHRGRAMLRRELQHREPLVGHTRVLGSVGC
mgnify:FL=1